MLSLNVPPPIHELLGDPNYKQYLLTVPEQPLTSSGIPWQVWALKTDYKWATKKFVEYRDAVKFLFQLKKREHDFQDVALTSVARLYRQPLKLHYMSPWCGRCRRPTVFLPDRRHHALRKAPVVHNTSDPRCYYCGLREEMMLTRSAA